MALGCVLLQVVRLCDLLDARSCLRKLDAALEAEAMREQDWTGDWDWFVSLLVAAERWRQQCPMFFGAALARGGSELCSFYADEGTISLPIQAGLLLQRWHAWPGGSCPLCFTQPCDALATLQSAGQGLPGATNLLLQQCLRPISLRCRGC